MKDHLAALETILRVEAPPFLFTRILQKVQRQSTEYVSPRIAWAFTLSMITLVILNIAVVSFGNGKPDDDFAKYMHLMPHNSLYHE